MSSIPQPFSHCTDIPRVDSYEIEQALRIFHPEGSVFEVRIILADKRIVHCYFTDPVQAAATITQFDHAHRPKGIYTTLQRLDAGLADCERRSKV